VYRTRMVRCQALVLDELRSETRKVRMGKRSMLASDGL
jgi:hypothetical protein